MKKTLCAALAVLMALTLLPGCNKESGSMTADGKTKLHLGLPGGDGGTVWEIVENFKTANSDKYEITTDESAWGDFTKKLQLQVASKQDVTPVFFTDSMQAMTFGANGQALDLKDWVDSDLDTSLYNNALFAITDAEGHLWGVPHALNSIGIAYNKDIFDERGVAYPTEDWTFQDMLDMAEKLTFTREDGSKVYGINYHTNITQGWLPFMCAVGVSPYSEDYQYSNLEDPKVKEAMEKYYYAIGKGCMMDAAELSAIGGQEQAFAQGHMAMIVLQSSGIAKINNWDADLNYDAQIMPIGWNGERTCIYVPNTWQIYSGVDENVEVACKDWLKYYLSEEAQMLVASKGSGFPVMQSALDAVSGFRQKPEHIDAFYRGIDEHGQTLLENPSSSVSRTIVDAMCNDIRHGEDIDARIAEAHAEMVDTLDDFYER